MAVLADSCRIRALPWETTFALLWGIWSPNPFWDLSSKLEGWRVLHVISVLTHDLTALINSLEIIRKTFKWLLTKHWGITGFVEYIETQRQQNFIGYNAHVLFPTRWYTLIHIYPHPSQLGFQALARGMEASKSGSRTPFILKVLALLIHRTSSYSCIFNIQNW